MYFITNRLAVRKGTVNEMSTKFYACYNRNEEIRMKSSSGGIYSLIAEKIIQEKGVIFAACYDENLEVVHRKIVSLEGLEESRGSKYVSSKLGDTFLDIKKEIEIGNKVLFVGTPCQCEGLLSFLQGKTNNLLCIDFVCHGVPGRNAWRAYLDSLRRMKIEPQKINMRDKSTGWSRYRYSWRIKDKNGKEVYQLQNENTFMKGFVRDLYLRPSCLKCQFKGVVRKTDITMGDYWGCWNTQPSMDDDKGTSLILIHTDKGMKIFESIKDDIVCESATEENAVKYNPSIIKSSLRCSEGERKYFVKCIHKGMDFIVLTEQLTDASIIGKIRRKCIKLFY